VSTFNLAENISMIRNLILYFGVLSAFILFELFLEYNCGYEVNVLFCYFSLVGISMLPV
jgi:hypothetical protein